MLQLVLKKAKVQWWPWITGWTRPKGPFSVALRPFIPSDKEEFMEAIIWSRIG